MAARGLVDPKKGLSLRFPRFMRKRLDKRLCDATTPQQLAELFSKQSVQNASKSGLKSLKEPQSAALSRPQVAMASALARLCGLAQAQSGARERLKAAAALFSATQGATATVRAALRVLWTELRGLQRCASTKQEASATASSFRVK